MGLANRRGTRLDPRFGRVVGRLVPLSIGGVTVSAWGGLSSFKFRCLLVLSSLVPARAPGPTGSSIRNFAFNKTELTSCYRSHPQGGTQERVKDFVCLSVCLFVRRNSVPFRESQRKCGPLRTIFWGLG